jgi:hypothetical protein
LSEASEKKNKAKFGFGRFTEFSDYLVSVFLNAPHFPPYEWERGAPLRTLKSEFDKLRKGMPIAYDRIKDKHRIPEAEALLEECYRAYESGNDTAGTLGLQDLRELILELRRGRARKGAESQP